ESGDLEHSGGARGALRDLYRRDRRDEWSLRHRSVCRFASELLTDARRYFDLNGVAGQRSALRAEWDRVLRRRLYARLFCGGGLVDLGDPGNRYLVHQLPERRTALC